MKKAAWPRSRVLTNGAVFEQAVNFARLRRHPAGFGHRAHRPELAGRSFQAMGVRWLSIRSALTCSTQPRQRAFLHRRKPGEAPVWWFGGGFDLTPFYGFEEDAVHWHRTAADLYAVRRRGLPEI